MNQGDVNLLTQLTREWWASYQGVNPSEGDLIPGKIVEWLEYRLGDLLRALPTSRALNDPAPTTVEVTLTVAAALYGPQDEESGPPPIELIHQLVREDLAQRGFLIDRLNDPSTDAQLRTRSPHPNHPLVDNEGQDEETGDQDDGGEDDDHGEKAKKRKYSVRRHAARGLGAIADVVARDALIVRLEDRQTQGEVRVACAEALGLVGDETARDSLIRFVAGRGVPIDVRIPCAGALAEISDEVALEALGGIAEDSTVPHSVRAACVELLGKPLVIKPTGRLAPHRIRKRDVERVLAHGLSLFGSSAAKGWLAYWSKGADAALKALVWGRIQEPVGWLRYNVWHLEGQEGDEHEYEVTDYASRQIVDELLWETAGGYGGLSLWPETGQDLELFLWSAAVGFSPVMANGFRKRKLFVHVYGPDGATLKAGYILICGRKGCSLEVTPVSNQCDFEHSWVSRRPAGLPPNEPCPTRQQQKRPFRLFSESDRWATCTLPKEDCPGGLHLRRCMFCGGLFFLFEVVRHEPGPCPTCSERRWSKRPTETWLPLDAASPPPQAATAPGEPTLREMRELLWNEFLEDRVEEWPERQARVVMKQRILVYDSWELALGSVDFAPDASLLVGLTSRIQKLEKELRAEWQRTLRAERRRDRNLPDGPEPWGCLYLRQVREELTELEPGDLRSEAE